MGSCRRCLSSGGPSQSWGHVSGFLMGSDKGWALARAVGPGEHPLDILLFYRLGVELRGFVSRLPGVGKTRRRRLGGAGSSAWDSYLSAVYSHSQWKCHQALGVQSSRGRSWGRYSFGRCQCTYVHGMEIHETGWGPQGASTKSKGLRTEPWDTLGI